MRDPSHANTAYHDAIVKNGDAARIDGVRITVVELGFAGENAQAAAGCARERGRRIDRLPRKKLLSQRAAAVGVLYAVEVGGGRVVHARRKMDAGDEAHGSGRERRLVVAEIGGGTGQGNGDVVHIQT